MIISEDNSGADYQIRAYKPGEIKVNDDYYHNSIIVSPHQLIVDWQPQSFEDLTSVHFQPIIQLEPEVVLLGTGTQFKIPTHEILSCLYAAKIGIEYMDTRAACRTYAALSAEGRNVVAALLIK